ncbi:hypothetical protein FQN60_006120 [Etheostoma spectabile]|uniref:Uncharacterized protein n=1 Tax=Etheostoma spectabile TaxID=54343 RepID=A0A5J5CNF3_9PERO|nr:hypothetical protein FQN60_006120 [Etheostoma spectabile]
MSWKKVNAPKDIMLEELSLPQTGLSSLQNAPETLRKIHFESIRMKTQKLITQWFLKLRMGVPRTAATARTMWMSTQLPTVPSDRSMVPNPTDCPGYGVL